VEIFKAYNMETLYLQHICRISEAKLKRLPLLQRRFLRVNKARTEDVKTGVKLEIAVAMQVWGFFIIYLFIYICSHLSIHPTPQERTLSCWHPALPILFL